MQLNQHKIEQKLTLFIETLKGNLVTVHASKEHPIKTINKNLAMQLNQHKIEQKHTIFIETLKGKPAVVHHARGCHMGCAGDSCRQTMRPEAAHGLHVSRTFYYYYHHYSENRRSVLFATEDRAGSHVMCCVNRLGCESRNSTTVDAVYIYRCAFQVKIWTACKWRQAKSKKTKTVSLQYTL